jgi:glucose/arabinose dehydrogenase
VGADPSAVDPASRENLWIVDQPYSNHNAGHLAFGPDGMLYVPWGDGGSRDDPLGAGQDPSTPLGSMHRLDVSPATGFVAPADNPFVGQEDIPATTWAIGLRNPWKFSFDRQTGDLWIADVGQDRWEEINRQPASSTGGENYGWNVMEGAHCRAGACDPSGFVAPVHEYGHDAGCSITGGVVYRGAIAALAGHYLFSDFCRGGLRSVPVTAEGVGAEVDWGPIVDPAGTTLLAVSTFGETAAGEVVVASLQTGRIHLLVAE